MGRRGGLVRALLAAVAAVVAVTGAAWAAPAEGEMLPEVRARDLNGRPKSLQELVEGERTLLVAITDRDAGPKMRAWFDAADTRAPESTHRVSVLALDLPFFFSEDQARERARPQVPQKYWDETLLSAQGELSKALGLGEGDEPWAFVIDEDGRVVAAVHGTVDSPEAGEIWRALRR